MKTKPETMISALKILARDIQSDDGVANACIAEASELIEEFNAKDMELREENIRLRAALAQSPGACHYCQLPKDQWAACKSGFPGCARMDDATGCPEFGAMMEYGILRDACCNVIKAWGEHGPNSGFTGNAIEDLRTAINYNEKKDGE